ncbi:hypothetical protein ACSSS7_005516 [Eimeria intestinalis]
MAPRVLLPVVMVSMLGALAATHHQSAALEHKLLQVTSSLQTSELKARVSSWKSSSNADELHSFALLYLKALANHEEQQQEEKETEKDRRRLCIVLSQALERWQQQHAHLIEQQQQQKQQQKQQKEQQRDQQQNHQKNQHQEHQQEHEEHVQRGQIRELIELMEAAAAAECSAVLQPQLQGVSLKKTAGGRS